MEHRWGDRRRAILRVQLHACGHASAIGWLTDISLSGAYVRTRAELALLSQISIDFAEGCNGFNTLKPVQVPGRIARHGPTGIGVEWEEFAAATVGEVIQIATSSRNQLVGRSREGMRSFGLWTRAPYGTSNKEQSYPEP